MTRNKWELMGGIYLVQEPDDDPITVTTSDKCILNLTLFLLQSMEQLILELLQCRPRVGGGVWVDGQWVLWVVVVDGVVQLFQVCGKELVCVILVCLLRVGFWLVN